MTQNTYTGLVESSVESNNLQTTETTMVEEVRQFIQSRETGSSELSWSGETCIWVSLLFVVWFVWKMLGGVIKKVLGFIVKLLFGVQLFKYLRHGSRI